MGKRAILKVSLATLLILGASAAAPANPVDPAVALREFDTYCAGGKALWGLTLCGAMIIVDPKTRAAVANRNPSAGFTQSGSHWTGLLPKDIGVANTSVVIGGERFAEMMLPLPESAVERRVLFAHEAFHRLQPELGFVGREADNGHLDSMDGRTLARLEMAALQAALTRKAWRPAVLDALAYRAARLRRFSAAEPAETSLIANEGLAEYTGVKVGAGPAARNVALNRLQDGAKRQSLIRSFGYVVGPAYGLLLDRTGRKWRSKALKGASLPLLLQQALAVKTIRGARMDSYGAPAIVAEEAARSRKLEERRAQLNGLLIVGPIVTFPFEKMSIDFDPNTLFSLGDNGTAYSRATTIRDVWGELSVSGDILLDGNWSFARVPGPLTMAGNRVSGPGWSATLAPGYRPQQGARSGDAVIRKR